MKIKNFWIFSLLLLLGACGNTNTPSVRSELVDENNCRSLGEGQECETTVGESDERVELLETALEVSVKLSDSEITFLENKSSRAQGGVRLVCELKVNEGETYQFNQEGGQLTLITPERSYEMKRLGLGEGVKGTWSWQGYLESGERMIKSVIFLGERKLILRKFCEYSPN